MAGVVVNRQAREIVDLAHALGFTFEGYDGSGHVVLSLSDGTRTSIPATPSEYRGRKNSIAALERLSGRKLPRAKHRRSRKSFAVTADPEVEASRRRHAETFAEKADEREAARAAEQQRIVAAQQAAADERRRREIEDLMRPGR